MTDLQNIHRCVWSGVTTLVSVGTSDLIIIGWTANCCPDLQHWFVISTALTSLNTRTEETFCGSDRVCDDHFDDHSICNVSSIRVESSNKWHIHGWSMDTFVMLKIMIFTQRYCIFCAWSCEHTACINDPGDKILGASSCKIVSARFILTLPLKH